MTAPVPAHRLRPVEADDEPFLLALFDELRRDELAQLAVDEATLDALLRQQFVAQATAYAAYPEQDYRIIEVADEPIGRQYLSVVDGTLRVVDIAITARWRGRGIGTSLLTDVIERADRASMDVTLHIERWNPARSLYERLGFEPTSADDVYVLLTRRTG